MPGVSTFRASTAILASTLLWGTWWIPLRQLDNAGAGGPWATTVSFFVPLLLLAPFALPRWRRICAAGWPLLAAGVLVAAAVVLYAEGVTRGHVAPVVLLFYLAPVWSVLLGRVMLAVPITPGRMLAMALGLCGMAVIFGDRAGVPLPDSPAEWMGLVSGMCWAWSLVYLNRLERWPLLDKTFVQFIFIGPFYLALGLIPGGAAWTLPGIGGVDLETASWLLAVALIWTLPVILLTLYGAGSIDPGKVSILLSLEVVVGLGTAAWLTDEPFGAREMLGAVLIVGAGVIEVAAAAPRPAPGPAAQRAAIRPPVE